MTFIHSSADISKKTKIGKGTLVWHQAQLREGVTIGENCIIGKGVYIDSNCTIGSNVKIQNYACVYQMTMIADEVFIGPHVVITNDKYPRSTDGRGKLKDEQKWQFGTTIIQKGASIGAGSIILPGVFIGEFALIGAGSVISKNIQPHALVYGNPGVHHGFVCICGEIISRGKKVPQFFLCKKHR